MNQNWFSIFLLLVTTSVTIYLVLRGRRIIKYRNFQPTVMPRVTEIHCLNCGYDLRSSPEICPECGLPVMWTRRLDATRLAVDFPPSSIQPRLISPDEDAVTVHVTLIGREAKYLSQQLEARGMKCELRYQTTGPQVFDFSPGVPIHVVVWTQDVAAARAYIESVTIGESLQLELQ